MDAPGQVLAMGGGGFFADPESPLDDFLLSLSPAARPRVCFLPTPVGDSERGILTFYEAFSRRDCEVSCLKLFGMPEKPAEQLRDKDVIYVSGGNTANASTSVRAARIDSAAFGNRSARVFVTSSQRASTSAGVPSAKIDRNAAATISVCALGTVARRFRT